MFSSVLENGEDSFFFVHRTRLQQQLLHLYGTEVVILDSTYKTTKYDISLFLMSVCVNKRWLPRSKPISYRPGDNSPNQRGIAGPFVMEQCLNSKVFHDRLRSKGNSCNRGNILWLVIMNVFIE